MGRDDRPTFAASSRRRPGPITQGAVVERAGNSESSPNSILWLWVPAFAGTTAEIVGRVCPYSITACSGPAACLRSVALVEPINKASGMVQRMKTITSI